MPQLTSFQSDAKRRVRPPDSAVAMASSNRSERCIYDIRAVAMASCACGTDGLKYFSKWRLPVGSRQLDGCFYDTRAVIEASELIHRALDAPATAVEDVGIDHRGLHAAPSWKPSPSLTRPEGAAFEQPGVATPGMGEPDPSSPEGPARYAACRDRYAA
jgi:hypothetical protein